MLAQSPKCHHGNAHYCGHCAAEKAPKCHHGNAHYCGHCAKQYRR